MEDQICPGNRRHHSEDSNIVMLAGNYENWQPMAIIKYKLKISGGQKSAKRLMVLT